MGAILTSGSPACALRAPERNRYFYGKMLTDLDLTRETGYHNGKRWLINRLVLGCGVVCGLNVELDEGEEHAVIVHPGMAIDRWGREIVLEAAAGPIPIPPELLGPLADKDGPQDDTPYPGQKPSAEDPEARYRNGKGNGNGYDHGGNGGSHGEREEAGLHVVLCYHECTDEPTPVLAGDCRDEEPCQPGVIRERFRIELRPGCLPRRHEELRIPDVIASDGRVDYETLARAVSEPCPPCPDDPCIPLANLFLDRNDEGHCRRQVDIAIRPIVYSNDLLFQLILSAIVEVPSYRREK